MPPIRRSDVEDAVLRRLRSLEDRQEIQDLVVRYGFAIDDHDFERIRPLFAPDAKLRTHAGVVKGDGVDDIVAYYQKHFGRLGPSNHFVHGHLIEFDGEDRATGLVSSHAEVWRDELPMLTAMRYHDQYVRIDGRWVFRERVQSYMYFLDVREYADAFGAEFRVRTTPGSPQRADWPSWHIG